MTRTLTITLAIAAIGAFILVSAGCGFGELADEGKVAKTSDDYLRALAVGNTARACAQLSPSAKAGLDRPCAEEMQVIAARIGSDELVAAADAGVEIEVEGNRGSAEIRRLAGARLALVRVGDGWKIATGHSLEPGVLSADAATANATAGPAATQAQWILSKLNDGGITVADVERRFTPAYLKLVTPAAEIVRALEASRLERGPFRFLRWARPPTATEALAVVSTRQEPAAIRVRVAGARVNALEVTAPPPDVVRGGRFTGRHDIGGRKLMIRCVGSGAPTVVFEGPLIEDWYLFQERLAGVTRVCTYDRANARWGQSDPAATPRSGNALMADLRALLRAAHVPAPYVLVGHSNSGLFAQIFASRYPKLTAGLVLVDAVSATYFERDLALQKKHRPRDQYLEIRADRLRVPPAVVDLERLDIARSQQELKSLLAGRPLRKLPLVVLSHGKAPPPQTDPRGQKLASATEALWRRLQTELAQLVPGARHVVARRSGHDIPQEQPELVIEAVRAVVKAVRDPSSW